VSALPAAALRFALGHWKGVLAGLGFAALAAMLVIARAETRHWQGEAERFAALHAAERAAHQRTIADYRRAAELARAQGQAHAARIERDQAVISQEVANDYAERIAALRARHHALGLRRRADGAAAADPGAGRATDLPQAAAAPGGAAAPAGAEGFPAEPEDDWRLTCSLQAEQLDALIDWMERQQAAAKATDAGAAE
jgi:hypothetical protein